MNSKFVINRNIIIVFLVGISIGLILMNLITPKRPATIDNPNEVILKINDQELTANNYYKYLKKDNGIQVLLDIIDNHILSGMYKQNEEMYKAINKQADEDENYYVSYYGKTVKDFYASLHLKNRDEYLEKLKLKYRREKYYNEYLTSLIKENEIMDYYNNNVFGDIKTKYIAVSIDNPNADTILREIIEKLNDGATYEKIVTEYKDLVSHDDLGYMSYKQENYETYLKSLLALEDNTYTPQYVETYYGYTIIFREDQKEKITYADAKKDITAILVDKLNEQDPTLYQRSLIELRKKNNIDFEDEEIENLYEDYCSNYY